MKEQSNGVPAALPTLLRAVEAEQASGCAAAEAARVEAHRRWAAVAKPLGSLGLLEAAVEDAAALGQSAEVRFDTRAVLVLCADNGVVRQGVSQVDSTVTAVAARSIAAGRSRVGQMAALAHCDVLTVDMGMQKPVSGAGLLERRIGAGTADITEGPAMTRAQAEQAVLTGAALVRTEQERGCTLLATGEMGIGNTTTSAAVACALLRQPARAMTGRGAGLSDAGLRRKRWAVDTALAVNRPDPADALDVLAKVGCFDLAGLCGVFLGGALYRVPVLMDGFISAVAALCALRLCPAVGAAVFASHVSAEPGHSAVLRALGKTPLIAAQMRLGEGTGAVAAMPLLDMALAVYRGTTVEVYGIPAYVPQEGAQ